MPLRVEPALLLALSFEDEEFAPGVSMTGFALAGPIEIGLTVSAESQIFGYTRAQIAALAGVRPQFRYLELDLAGTFGIAGIGHAGDFLSDDPGGSGSVEFVGGRLGAMVPVFVSKRGQVLLGVGASVGYEHDLDQYRVNYQYIESDPWFSEGPELRMGSQEIGGSERWLLRIAFVLGLQ